MSDELERLRDEIDALDVEVLRLLAERFRRVAAIGREKARRGLPIEDPEREADLAHRYASAARSLGLHESVAEGLFALLLGESKRHQRDVAEPGASFEQRSPE